MNLPSTKTAIGVLAFLGFLPMPVLAQRGPRPEAPADRRPAAPAISLSLGRSPYDLLGTGTAFVGAFRVDVPVGRLFLVEPGMAFLRYQSSDGSDLSRLLPEVSFQVQAPGKWVRPYAGVGLGEAEFLSGRGSSLFTAHAAGGVRVSVGRRWGLRGEVRLRSIDPWTGHTTDMTVGVSRALR